MLPEEREVAMAEIARMKTVVLFLLGLECDFGHLDEISTFVNGLLTSF